MYLNDTLPVAPEKKMLPVTLKLPKLMDFKETKGIKVTPTSKNTIKEQHDERNKRREKLLVREHCFKKKNVKWSKLSTCNKGKKTLK